MYYFATLHLHLAFTDPVQKDCNYSISQLFLTFFPHMKLFFFFPLPFNRNKTPQFARDYTTHTHTHTTAPKQHLKAFVWCFPLPHYKTPPCWSHLLCGILQRSVKTELIIALKNTNFFNEVRSNHLEGKLPGARGTDRPGDWSPSFQRPSVSQYIPWTAALSQSYNNLFFLLAYGSVQVARRFGTKSGQIPKVNREVQQANVS